MSSGFKSGGPRGGRGGENRFRTDSDISASRTGRERTLQRWDEGDAASVPAHVDLNSLGSPAEASKWDQFAANREKFGVQSTYDERLYTTEIDTSHPEYAERERRAAQIAREIERQGAGDSIHVAEERGIAIDDSQMDEEDRYSGVQRAPAFVANEARKAMASPTYLRDRERGDRLEDLRRFSQDYRVQSPVPPDLLPILGKKPKGSAATKEAQRAEHKGPASKAKDAGKDTVKGSVKESGAAEQRLPEKSQTTPASSAGQTPKAGATPEPGKDAKPKPSRFNFSAAAAKASSFKSSLSPQPFSPPPFSPSGRQASFSPHSVPMQPLASASPVPSVSPPMPAVMPYGFVPHQQGYAPSMPMPFMPPIRSPSAGPSAGASPGSGSASPDPVELRPLGTSFDFFAQLAAKGEAAPKAFFTPPSWTTTSEMSYVDQFSAMSPRAPPVMPYGFMIPQF